MGRQLGLKTAIFTLISLRETGAQPKPLPGTVFLRNCDSIVNTLARLGPHHQGDLRDSSVQVRGPRRDALHVDGVVRGRRQLFGMLQQIGARGGAGRWWLPLSP